MGCYRIWTEEDNEKFYLKGVFFAADIVFTNRFIYDQDLETCVRVTGEVQENMPEYTTDILMKASEFDKCDIFTPKLKLMSFDIENSIKYNNIYCICFTVINEEDGSRQDRKIFSNFSYQRSGHHWQKSKKRATKTSAAS